MITRMSVQPIVPFNRTQLAASCPGIASLVGTVIEITNIPVSEVGKFTAEFGQQEVDRCANPITGRDIVATITLMGLTVSEDIYAGDATGRVSVPLQAPLRGSTFAAVRKWAISTRRPSQACAEAVADVEPGTGGTGGAGGAGSRRRRWCRWYRWRRWCRRRRWCRWRRWRRWRRRRSAWLLAPPPMIGSKEGRPGSGAGLPAFSERAAEYLAPLAAVFFAGAFRVAGFFAAGAFFSAAGFFAAAAPAAFGLAVFAAALVVRVADFVPAVRRPLVFFSGALASALPPIAPR